MLENINDLADAFQFLKDNWLILLIGLSVGITVIVIVIKFLLVKFLESIALIAVFIIKIPYVLFMQFPLFTMIIFVLAIFYLFNSGVL